MTGHHDAWNAGKEHEFTFNHSNIFTDLPQALPVSLN
jgi:hypothetical protein